MRRRSETGGEAPEQVTFEGGGFPAVMKRILDPGDPGAEYARILAAIEPIEVGRADYGTLAGALDRAQDIAREAGLLAARARVEHARTMRDAERIRAELRERATVKLEAEKEAGIRKKAITNGDVDAALVTAFGDEWHALDRQETEGKAMLEGLDDLAERARERAKDLRALVARSREV
jgi:hypothetical protein